MTMKFKSQKPHYEYLRKKWLSKHRAASENFLSKHGDSLKRLTLGGLGGLMLFSTPGMSQALPGHISITDDGVTKERDRDTLLAEDLKTFVPPEVRRLTPGEEEKLAGVLSDDFKMEIRPEIDGIRLNRSYGLIGGEQHLYRFPGDNVHRHADNAADWAMFGGAGIAPGLGAWGYFSHSESGFTAKDKARERYYLAVQTFLAPGFAENVGRYRDFFRFRKMLVVNPKTGQAVVGVVGDAGPAEWIGKHLGGSPEVMHYLGLATGPRKGAVLYFFINDLKDEVPLGPIKMKKEVKN